MSDSAAKLVTIGITCFNAADTIAQAVESALAQSWPLTEIIIIDDCSTDASPQILAGLAQQYPQLRIIRQPHNQGVGVARNLLVQEARGEYLAFFDDDDISYSQRIAQQVERLEAYRAAHNGREAICYGDRDTVTDSGRTGEAFGIGRTAPEPAGKAIALSLLAGKTDPHFCWGELGSGTMLARTAFLREIGGFDRQFRRMAEWDLAIRASYHDCALISVPEKVILQRITPTTDKRIRARVQNRLALIAKHKAFLQQEGLYYHALARTAYFALRGILGKS